MTLSLAGYLHTIRAIASSKHLNQYLIGFTSASARDKFKSYRGVNFTNFVILEDKLSMKEALDLEEALFNAAIQDKAHINYMKYHHEKRNLGYRRSSGGKEDDDRPIHSVYMAWWE